MPSSFILSFYPHTKVFRDQWWQKYGDLFIACTWVYISTINTNVLIYPTRCKSWRLISTRLRSTCTECVVCKHTCVAEELTCIFCLIYCKTYVSHSVDKLTDYTRAASQPSSSYPQLNSLQCIRNESTTLVWTIQEVMLVYSVLGRMWKNLLTDTIQFRIWPWNQDNSMSSY